MSWKTLLVHLDPHAQNDALIGWAADLAARTGARLLGLAAAQLRVNVYRGMSPRAASELLQRETEALESRLASLGEAFLAAAGAGAAYRGMIGDADQLLADHARVADVVVMVPDPERESPDAAAVVLTAGRPVLLAAPDLRPLGPGTAIVAWKDTREARRAVADALPLLRLARDVRVVAVIESGEAAVRESAADVVEYLRRHEVQAGAELIEPVDGEIGAALAAAARDLGADIVVSGGFTHGPLRQRVFGGVTRSLLEDAATHRMLSF